MRSFSARIALVVEKARAVLLPDTALALVLENITAYLNRQEGYMKL